MLHFDKTVGHVHMHDPHGVHAIFPRHQCTCIRALPKERYAINILGIKLAVGPIAEEVHPQNGEDEEKKAY